MLCWCDTKYVCRVGEISGVAAPGGRPVGVYSFFKNANLEGFEFSGLIRYYNYYLPTTFTNSSRGA